MLFRSLFLGGLELEIVDNGGGGLDKRIGDMYRQDCIIITIAVVILWSVLSYVILNVSRLSENHSMGLIIASVGVVVCVFGTASSKAVLSHLKKNKETIYLEDITYSKKTFKEVVDDEIWKK